MEQQKKLGITLEIVFWIVTIISCVGVLYPIYNNFNNFPFLWRNGLAIVIFVTYTRYIFLWQYALFSKSTIVRLILLVIAIPLVFHLIQNMNNFQTYLDNSGYDAFMELLKKPLSDDERAGLLQYIRSEFVFFSTGATIAGIILPLRMIISFWRTKNNKGV